MFLISPCYDLCTVRLGIKHNEFSHGLILFSVVWLSYVAHERTPRFLLAQPASKYCRVFSRAYYTVQGTKTCFSPVDIIMTKNTVSGHCGRQGYHNKRITWLFEGIINIQGQMISRMWALIIQVNNEFKLTSLVDSRSY